MISKILTFFRNLFNDAVPDDTAMNGANDIQPTIVAEPDEEIKESNENIFDGINGDSFLTELKSSKTNLNDHLTNKDDIKRELKKIAKKYTGI